MTPPYNRDAELSVLGCILSAGSYSPNAGRRIVERVRATGITPASFWFPTHAALYAILEHRADEALALDPVSVAAAIEEEAWRRLAGLAELAALADTIDVEILRAKLEMLAAAVTAFGNVESHATIVVKQARRRAGLAGLRTGEEVA